MRGRLSEPVDSSFLAFFRVWFGAVMAVDGLLNLVSGTVEHVWARPTFHFSYPGFAWVIAVPRPWMHVVFAATVVLGVLVALGLCYRVSAILLAVGFTYTFLVERAAFQNHFYLLCLLSGLMAILPAHHRWSLDVRRGAVDERLWAPSWTLWLLRLQIGVVYFFGGLAKLDPDWLTSGPVSGWIAGRFEGTWIAAPAILGGLTYLINWGGLGFDLLVVPGLLWARTRIFAFASALLFHLSNAFIFTIGVFPWFMIGATVLFFSPQMPVRLLRRLTGKAAPARPSRGATAHNLGRGSRWGTVLLGTYCGVQLLLPVRPWLYPGDASWTEEGHRFSWRMMLREKRVLPPASRLERDLPEWFPRGHHFAARTGGGRITWPVRPERYLEPWQVDIMLRHPDLIRQFCRGVAHDIAAQGVDDVEVYVNVWASLNGRRAQRLVDPLANLASQEWTLGPSTWILPLRAHQLTAKVQGPYITTSESPPFRADR
ncbi:MAG: HTTM domain-containing protein [Candidatus Latescibacterota bacterium]